MPSALFSKQVLGKFVHSVTVIIFDDFIYLIRQSSDLSSFITKRASENSNHTHPRTTIL